MALRGDAILRKVWDVWDVKPRAVIFGKTIIADALMH
jgi:hypothetical protein